MLYDYEVGRRHPGESQTSFSPIPTNLQDVGRIMKNCTIEDCKNKYYAKGYCEKHYTRLRKYSNPSFTKIEMHGMVKTAEYAVWRDMIQRCHNKNHEHYHCYGGRGIAVYKRWRNSFMAFYIDMGPRPFPKAQIDRIDNDGDYTLQNCHWATHARNNQNKSNNRLTMEKAKTIRRKYKSENISQRKLAWIYGVCPMTINYVVNQRSWKN